MKTPLDTIASELGFMSKPPFAYTIIEHYHVTMVYNASMNTYFFQVPIAPLVGDQAAQLSKYCIEHRKEMGIHVDFSAPQALLFQKSVPFGRIKAEQYRLLLDFMIRALQFAEVQPQLLCVLCEQSQPDTTAFINELYVPVHDRCKSDAIHDFEAVQQEASKQDPQLVKGIFGAFVGAILGSFPWIAVDIVFEMYAAVLGFLIGASALFFYQKFGGRVVKSTHAIIVGMTIFGIIFANLVIATYILINVDALLVLDNYLILYTDPEIAPMMLGNLALGLFIGLLSLPAIFKKITKEQQPAVRIS